MTHRAATLTEFARVCGITLTPGQRAFHLVASDGVDPCDLEGDDRERARVIFGDVDTVPPLARTLVGVVAGAASGKSFAIGALRAVHLALTVPLDILARRQRAHAIIVAPDLRLSRESLRYALGIAEGTPGARVREPSADSFVLLREQGREVEVSCLPATSTGRATRGRRYVCVVLEEACHFRDEKSGIVNDREVFSSIDPRILPGGQTLIVSTPYVKSGVLWELYKENFGRPSSALVAHASTQTMQDTQTTRAMILRQRAIDPQNARREFDAEFLEGGAAIFFDPGAVDDCVDQARLTSTPLPPTLFGAWRGFRASAAIDLGFTSDASSIVVVGSFDAKLDEIEVMHVEELAPEADKPLVPGVVAERFAKVLARYELTDVAADSHYLESLREHLAPRGIEVHHLVQTQESKAAQYLALRERIATRKLKMPPFGPLISALKEVSAQPTSGGGLSIRSPRRRHGHGDTVSALVLAHTAAITEANADAIGHRAIVIRKSTRSGRSSAC